MRKTNIFKCQHVKSRENPPPKNDLTACCDWLEYFGSNQWQLRSSDYREYKKGCVRGKIIQLFDSTIIMMKSIFFVSILIIISYIHCQSFFKVSYNIFYDSNYPITTLTTSLKGKFNEIWNKILDILYNCPRNHKFVILIFNVKIEIYAYDNN